MIIDEEVHLEHYGILRRSGRYPWGSGNNQSTRNKDFLSYFEEMRRQGLTEAQACAGVGITTTEFRAARSIARNQQKQEQIGWAQRLHDKGMSNVAIGERMGLNESSVRALLAPGAKAKADALTKTSEMLKREVDSKKYLDVGVGTENYLGVSRERLGVAVAMLVEKGYRLHSNIKVPQISGTGLNTTMKILTPPGTTESEVWKNRDKIKQITEFSKDGGHTFGRIHDPISINPNRVSVKYKEDGGAEADGVIYVRPGIKDISIGEKRYAQVRIKIGDDHYLKGMAMYKDDLPAGTDLLFNTNKSNTGNKLDVMKRISDDPEYPFESVVRQLLKDEGTPHERVTSAMNIVGGKEGAGEEGAWASWSRGLAAQFLSKQSPSLAKAQTDKAYDRRRKDLDEIKSLTNPVVKKKLLDAFADGSDAAAVQLEAAAMNRRQGWHVILPVNSLSPNQIYAPRFRNGERVVLIRYPHGGTFEIPRLVVNNKNREARQLLGNAEDAVGIHHSVAQQLSGADFDGDTVVVIPDNAGKIKASPALERLMSFNPRDEYPGYPGMVPLGKREQQEMGSVSNLITDMTLRGAPHNEIANAIRHSMVVIDANNHNLNYRQSAIDHGIARLKAEYQGGATRGASTLISRSGSRADIPQRRPRRSTEGGPIDVTTGRKMYVETGGSYINKEGKRVLRTVRSTKLAEAQSAHELSSGTPIEKIYADHADRLKGLANEARLEMIRTPNLRYSQSAKQVYAKEVSSLNAKLAISRQNAPLERQAQIIANTTMRAKRAANPNLNPDSGSYKKIKYRELEIARNRTGASKKERQITITPDEWDAIQAGAISNHRLEQILTNTDLDVLRSYATPRRAKLMTPSNISRARDLFARGYTRAQVADRLGVSLSTLDTAMKGE